MFGFQSALFLAIGLVCLSATGFAKPSDDVDTHIVGGKDAPEGAYPYQVSLRKKTWTEYHSCGGSIIAPQWILTAAHCTISAKPENITVVTGSNKISSGGTRYKVAKIINHESYVPKELKNDIALIKVESEISYSDRVAPIALTEEATPGGVKCVLTGWGYTDNRRTTPDKLQVLDFTTITYEQCEKEYKQKKPSYLKYLNKGNLCTFRAYGQGACQGDSGGPLVAGDKQIGVVSWGTPCARGLPDVFASVFEYSDWIKKNMES